MILVALSATTTFTSGTPAGAARTYLVQPALNGVACPNTHSCFAVGRHLIRSREKTLVMRMNGTSWSMVASPTPPGKINALLNGVSCAKATDCFAVGSYENNSWSRTLIERWNGKSWSIVASPNPPGENFATLNAIACPTTTSCAAVGNDTSSSWAKTLTEQWDGNHWSIVESPNPSGKIYVDVSGVACPSSNSCYAVGNYSSHTWARTLVERWDGTNWSIVATPNPHGLIAYVATARMLAAGLPLPRVLITADDVAAGKPHPECYLAAAQRVGIPTIDCVVVEDAPAGIEAAHAAGMRVIAVETTHSPVELQTPWIVPDARALHIEVRAEQTSMDRLLISIVK